MRALGLMKPAQTPAPRVLPVVQLIERVAKHPRDTVAGPGSSLVQLLFDRIKLGIVTGPGGASSVMSPPSDTSNHFGGAAPWRHHDRRLASRSVTDTPLPEPDSEELYALVGQAALRVLYGWLYRRRENPPTMAEVRLFMADALGEPQEHIDRRLRKLRRHFAIPAERQGQGDPRYVLRGWAETAASHHGINISERLRAQVLAPQRCAQCGRTPQTTT